MMINALFGIFPGLRIVPSALHSSKHEPKQISIEKAGAWVPTVSKVVRELSDITLGIHSLRGEFFAGSATINSMDSMKKNTDRFDA